MVFAYMVYRVEFSFVLENDNLLMQFALFAIVIAAHQRGFGAIARRNMECLAELLEMCRILALTDIGKCRGATDGEPVLTRLR